MPFYKSLTPYYDEIFPANEKAMHFLAERFKKDGHILDVGAGTGNMALALAKRGFHLTAAEPEEIMAEQIEQKAQLMQLPITVSTKTMQQLNQLDEMYDGIYCIGNTLVHLNSLEEIRTFIGQVYEKLNKNGVFIFQIVNFDKVLLKQDFRFPIIEKEHFTFERQYDLADSGHILFTTTITANNVAKTNTIPLYPAQSAQLLAILEQSGFNDINAYGNFEDKAYSMDTPALIITAKKI